MESFASRLRDRATTLKLSDAEVARRLKIGPRRYGHYVKGARRPDFAFILKICAVLQTNPNYLLGYTADPTDEFGSLKPDEILVIKRYRAMLAATAAEDPFVSPTSSPSKPSRDDSRELSQVKVAGRRR